MASTEDRMRESDSKGRRHERRRRRGVPGRCGPRSGSGPSSAEPERTARSCRRWAACANRAL